MSNGEPWRHDIFGYGTSVSETLRLHPKLLLKSAKNFCKTISVAASSPSIPS
jgi:hypothetical protein